MKNLQSFGVQELKQKDIEDINGGSLGWGSAFFAYFVYETLSNPKSSGKSFSEGFEAGQNIFK